MTEHRLSTHRRARGTRRIRGGGTLFATVGSCPCGWGDVVNIAPSAGGTEIIEDAFGEHLAEAGKETS